MAKSNSNNSHNEVSSFFCPGMKLSNNFENYKYYRQILSHHFSLQLVVLMMENLILHSCQLELLHHQAVVLVLIRSFQLLVPVNQDQELKASFLVARRLDSREQDLKDLFQAKDRKLETLLGTVTRFRKVLEEDFCKLKLRVDAIDPTNHQVPVVKAFWRNLRWKKEDLFRENLYQRRSIFLQFKSLQLSRIQLLVIKVSPEIVLKVHIIDHISVRGFVAEYAQDPEFEAFELLVDGIPFVALSLMNAHPDLRGRFKPVPPPTPMKKHTPGSFILNHL